MRAHKSALVKFIHFLSCNSLRRENGNVRSANSNLTLFQFIISLTIKPACFLYTYCHQAWLITLLAYSRRRGNNFLHPPYLESKMRTAAPSINRIFSSSPSSASQQPVCVWTLTKTRPFSCRFLSPTSSQLQMRLQKLYKLLFIFMMICSSNQNDSRLTRQSHHR